MEAPSIVDIFSSMFQLESNSLQHRSCTVHSKADRQTPYDQYLRNPEVMPYGHVCLGYMWPSTRKGTINQQMSNCCADVITQSGMIWLIEFALPVDSGMSLLTPCTFLQWSDTLLWHYGLENWDGWPQVVPSAEWCHMIFCIPIQNVLGYLVFPHT